MSKILNEENESETEEPTAEQYAEALAEMSNFFGGVVEASADNSEHEQQEFSSDYDSEPEPTPDNTGLYTDQPELKAKPRKENLVLTPELIAENLAKYHAEISEQQAQQSQSSSSNTQAEAEKEKVIEVIPNVIPVIPKEEVEILPDIIPDTLPKKDKGKAKETEPEQSELSD